MLQKLYFNDWVRIPVKFVFSFLLIKVGYDYSEYVTAYRFRRTNPRFCGFDEQSPTAPPIPAPYPYYKTYEQYMDIKRWYDMNNKAMKLWCLYHDRFYVLVDLPCRQNINAIDQLMMRAKQYACSQNIKFHLLNQMAQKQGSVPVGVYKQIRQICQPQLQINAPLIPQL